MTSVYSLLGEDLLGAGRGGLVVTVGCHTDYGRISGNNSLSTGNKTKENNEPEAQAVRVHWHVLRNWSGTRNNKLHSGQARAWACAALTTGSPTFPWAPESLIRWGIRPGPG